MPHFFGTIHCDGRNHCSDCRSKSAIGVQWRKSLSDSFEDVPSGYFPCPYGFTDKSNITSFSIPRELLEKSFTELCADVEATDDKNATNLVNELKEQIKNASCKACKRNNAEARLRLWLSEHIVEKIDC